MIREFEFFHGVVLSRIVHDSGIITSIEPYPTKTNSSYIVNGKIGIYIKYSTKRMSPWRFSFMKQHQDEIQEMQEKLKSVFVILVCDDDGIVCLSYNELKQILDEKHNEIEWIAIQRKKREKYKVSGTDGELQFKIGEIEFPQKIFL